MNKKLGEIDNNAVCIYIPKQLYERVEVYCGSNGIVPNEFILDAVSEKLASVHRERRRKQRL